MLAFLLTPLTIASLLSGTTAEIAYGTNVRPDTVPEKSEALPPPAIDTSIPMLNLDIIKRLAAVKKELEPLAKKHPSLGGPSLGIAMQSRSLDRFLKSEPFTELVQKHGFTPKQFFAAYSEVVGGLFILNVEKQINQNNLTEAQGFKVIPPNKNFIIKNRKLIDELKLGDTYVGPRPRDNGLFGAGRDPMQRGDPMDPTNPSNPMDPSEPTTPSNPMDPMDPMDPMGSPSNPMDI